MMNFGRDYILVGLSAENLREMQAGKPLVVGPVENDHLLANAQILVVVAESAEQVTAILDKHTNIVPPPAG